MRATGFAAIMLVAASAGAAHGELNDPDWAMNWSRRAEALARSLALALTLRGAPDREIIRPPGNVDPKMVLAPRQNQGRMRIITPPGTGRWW
jgi:hypothetical protein